MARCTALTKKYHRQCMRDEWINGVCFMHWKLAKKWRKENGRQKTISSWRNISQNSSE